MKNGWIESSRAEIALAQPVAQALLSECMAVSQICQAIEDLAFDLTKENSATVLPAGKSREVAELRDSFPELEDIDLARPFPQDDTDLTTNFFGRLAHELGLHFASPADRGMVGTPPVLAMDMVALALTFWLVPRTDIPKETLWSAVFGESALPPDQHEQVRRLLSDIRWYDPCVGGGVFPVSILLVLTRMGIAPNESLLRNVRGGDINAFSVASSYVRVALLLSGLTGKLYSVTRRNLPNSFSVCDSLGHYAEQASIEMSSPESEDPLADIVIGNPPYVRLDRIKSVAKAVLRDSYPSVAAGSADLYNYFIAHGLSALDGGGLLCYVSPAGFQKSKSGENTRRLIRKEGAVRTVFDFGELPIFSAGVHASVYAIEKSQPQESLLTYAFNRLPSEKPLLHGLERSKMIPSLNASGDAWSISHSKVQDILQSISRDSISLTDYAGPILSGIKAGHKKAFFVDGAAAKRLGNGDSRFLRPVLRPVGIRAWRAEWDGTHLVVVKKGEVVPEGSPLFEHMMSYEDGLRRRSDVQGHPTWYGLRECVYYDAFERPKIIFPDIASECRFAMDTTGYFIPDGAFMIPLEDYFLLGVLNSCVGRFYFRAHCNSIGNPHNGGRLRFKKTYVKGFPVPEAEGLAAQLRNEIGQLARQLAEGSQDDGLTDRIDELVLEAYRVPEEHRDIIREITIDAVS